MVAGDSQQPLRATRLLAAADAMRRRTGASLQATYRADQEALVDVLREQLGEDRFKHAWEDGERLTVELAIEESSQI